MRKEGPAEKRAFHTKKLDADLVVVGGGLAGSCCAVTAARAGARVILIQDRPVLGGNSSSEIRLWILGATSHMNSNNRWAREGGIHDELLVENTYRNPEGNPVIFDTVLLEKVKAEPNITLLLNSAMMDCSKPTPDTISGVRAFCSQNSTTYEARAPYFCDASGDGALAFISGAAFRMGAESAEEFGEKFAPSKEYGELLGHSIYFYSKDAGKPIKFTAPSYALKNVPGEIPRYRNFNTNTHGCRLWWIEWGGRLDTVHETETIKWELWGVVYGVWDYIKNSGKFPDARNLTLEWVGLIPGKRESRRFEGPYMLRQQDIIEQRDFYDRVAYGGWSIDLHPADGVFSEKPGCEQWHSRGIYQIPYRCLYSRNIKNLFLAGRIMSCSHVAFGSTRVQGTLACAGQAVGMAAAICSREHIAPDKLREPERMKRLQRDLLRAGQYIPGCRLEDSEDLAQTAKVTASSRFKLDSLPADGPSMDLRNSRAQLIPASAGRIPKFTVFLDVAKDTNLRAELYTSRKPTNHTPDVILGAKTVSLTTGSNIPLELDFEAEVKEPRYIFLALIANPNVKVRATKRLVTGLLSVKHTRTQSPKSDIGVESFEFWIPERRPAGHNFALKVEPPIDLFGPENVTNGIARPVSNPNAWAAALDDPTPTLTLKWERPQTVSRVELAFDTDFEHPMEQVLMGHPERVMPYCVKRFRVLAGGREVAAESDNHQTRRVIAITPPVKTDSVSVELLESQGPAPLSLFEVRCYAT